MGSVQVDIATGGSSWHLADDARRRGEMVIWIACRRPYMAIRSELEPRVDDPDKFVIMDLVSMQRGVPPIDSPRYVSYMPSPTQLEAIVSRLQKIAGRVEGPIHVVLDSIDGLVEANGAGRVEAFIQRLCGSLRQHEASGSLCLDAVVEDGDTRVPLQDWLSNIRAALA